MGSARTTGIRLAPARSTDRPTLAPVAITVKLRGGANASAALQRLGRSLPSGAKIAAVFPGEREEDLRTLFVIEVSVDNGEALARGLERVEGVEYAHVASARRTF